ncbi:pentatricopeptide repeat-containing protein At5g27110-like isoform X2 [Impatiens glandulifera]|uniref:pentatricopeptide repeat-containing protein At5g27110-like isoform X2 n=1 Tax=Impatiens glandulifera TaxID=253017 RepID=UPI001FB0AA0D|nr:pentatricopeptide repeat-containing protein At5g27110-like isoform X2 [Impatiens glandulifera]
MAISSLTFQAPLPISSSLSSNQWISIIKRHAKLKDDTSILSTYSQMESNRILPDVSICPIILKSCAKLQAFETGKKLHLDIIHTNLFKDPRVQTALIDFYCKCGYLHIAFQVFDEMKNRDVVSWNVMISGLVKCREYIDAIDMVRRMQMENVEVSSVTVVALLMACGDIGELRIGKEIHGYCLRYGIFDCSSHVGSALIGFYLRFDHSFARLVFDMMDLNSRNVVCWNSMLSAYSDCCDYSRVIDLFVEMIGNGMDFDLVTVLIVIQACAEIGCLELGEQVHTLAVKRDFIDDSFLLNALVNLYGKNGRFDSSCYLFDSTPIKDVVLWNSILSVHVNNSRLHEAMDLFFRMRFEGFKVNNTTLLILLSCVRNLKLGQSLHALIIKNELDSTNSSVGNMLITMYEEMNRVDDAMKVFNNLPNPDLISWNLSIMALARAGVRDRAFQVFGQMERIKSKPNSHTMIALLAACDSESDNLLRTEMYMNCKDYSTGIYLFETYLHRDVISWNSFMSSCVNNDLNDQVVELLHRMILEVEPNNVTFINILTSCINMGNLHHGRCVHAYALRREYHLDFDLSLANAFIAMYARCGKIHYAEKVFFRMPKRNVISWNALIDAYGMHGRGHEAMLTFSEMMEFGFRPNSVTFVSILSSCSHSGLTNEGLRLFHSMKRDFFVEPELSHYGCIVDLLGRSSCLNEAWEFINTMPISPDASIWRALLSACRVQLETRLAEKVFERLIELEPRNGGNYVLMSNMYAASGLWSEVRKVRLLMVQNGLKKPPGKSWIAVKGEVHCFRAGDKSHAHSDVIYSNLRCLLSSIKEMGYVPDMSWVLHETYGESNGLEMQVTRTI